jgi:site-specific recombinase XerD
MILIAPLVQAFFSDRLIAQRGASPNTISAYSDTFRLLLEFAERRLKKAPCDLQLDDLDATLIGKFLDGLESERKNSIRTRNMRLAAIRSFFSYVATREPTRLHLIQRVLAIPQKRFERKIVRFLDQEEAKAILEAPDRSSWIGQRDHALLLLTVQTGLRVSELIGLRIEDLQLGNSASVRCRGKGRKERCTPLTRDTVQVLKAWLKRRSGAPGDVLFPSIRGQTLSRDAVERVVRTHAESASVKQTSLKTKAVSPHVLRHTAAVRLLQAGVDRSVIALWLGHEQVETTQIYLDADLATKERAIARAAPLPKQGFKRYRPDDRLLAFLQGL